MKAATAVRKTLTDAEAVLTAVNEVLSEYESEMEDVAVKTQMIEQVAIDSLSELVRLWGIRAVKAAVKKANGIDPGNLYRPADANELIEIVERERTEQG
jgi:hypothetical protein